MDLFPFFNNYPQQHHQHHQQKLLAEDDETAGIREIETKNATHNVRPDDIPSDISPDQVDLLVAKQMTSLSMEDREKAYYDVHGVSEEVKETPEMLASSLLQLELELK